MAGYAITFLGENVTQLAGATIEAGRRPRDDVLDPATCGVQLVGGELARDLADFT